jgi:hypothetical protein
MVQSLYSIPNLRSLYINLTIEEQVDYIMRSLPNLLYLNGLPVVDRESLEADPVIVNVQDVDRAENDSIEAYEKNLETRDDD